MRSAIEVLPVRSMVVVSSAFMSSRRVRIRLKVSWASSRLETASGARRVAARGAAMAVRGPFPFDVTVCLSVPGIAGVGD
jgi:hypothetical protein